MSGSRSGKKKRIRFNSDLSNPSKGKQIKRRTESISKRSPNPNPKETKGKRIEGTGAYLGLTYRHHNRQCAGRTATTPLLPTRGTEPSCCSSLCVLAQAQGVAARPLDGGALSLGRARTPTKGPAAVPHFLSSGHDWWPPSPWLFCSAEARGEKGRKKRR
jgi:hypothetical protein